MSRHCLSLALSAIATLSLPARADLIVNGSFEDPDIPQNTFAVFSSIPGWTRYFGPSIEIQDRIVNNKLLPAYKGTQHLELDSFANTGIQQAVTIPSDGLYILSLAYSARPGRSASTNTVEVLWDSAVIGAYSLSGIGLNQLDWQLQFLAINAVAGDHILGLQSAGTSDTLGGLVDAVALEAAPEPGTWLMAVAGLAGVMVRARRRLSRSVARRL
ncbi:MAG: PEP-CTERM sorting domain-containing protein [Bryobacteraceae bacterium]